MVFFKAFPLINEELCEDVRANDGECLQMAMVDNEHRSALPGNPFGTGVIIGQDLEDPCDHKDRSAFITEILNGPTSGNMRGPYPSQECPSEEKTVIMQGACETKEMPSTRMHNEQEVNGRTEEAHNRENDQSINGDGKPAPQCDQN